MTVYQILSLLGVSSIVASVLTYLISGARKTSKRVKALCGGVQAVLRSRMIEIYNKYKEKGYAPIYAKQDFENCWTNYEALGANGVMSGIRSEFLALPNEETK